MSENKEEKTVKNNKIKTRLHFNIGRFFNNNQFVLFFSIFCAMALWILMTFNDTEKNPRAVADVPIAIKLSDSAQQAGLKVFSPLNAKAKVWIKGNSMTVNQVTNKDLQVITSQAASITAAGNYVLDLTVNKLTSLTDYQLVKIEPSSVNVYVDTYVEKVFHIDKSQIKYQIAPTYYMNEPTLSSEEVTVSGPQQEVEKIDKAILRCNTGSTPLTSTKRITSNVLLLDAYGNEVSRDHMKLSAETADITFNVLPRKVLPLSIEFTNMPGGMMLSKSLITIEPTEIEVAGPEDALANLSELQLTPVDFSTISPSHNTFDADVTLPETFKNVSNISTAKVVLDLSNMSTRTVSFHADAVKFRGLSSERTAQIYTKNLNVTVVGPESEISKITENNLVAQVDMTGRESFIGQTEMPATITVSGFSSSWVFGSYRVNVGISQKE